MKVHAHSMTDNGIHPKLPETGLACSLSGREQADRAIWLERLNERAVGVSSRPDGVTFTFALADDTEADVRALAAAEAQCCPFLSLEVERLRDRIELVVSGPPEARPIIEAMFEARR